MILTIYNINDIQKKLSVIKKQRVMNINSKNKYILLNSLNIRLTNGDIITIPKGFEWDLSSVPRFLWSFLNPEGDFELAALIHDYLYVNKKKFNYTRKFVDDEMYKWSKVLNGTKKISYQNFDNWLRWVFVRLLGGLVWNDYIKIK